MTTTPSRFLWLTVAVLLSAFALRLTALADQQVWWDEAWSAWVAQQDIATVTDLTARDVHPPLYQWALHGWVRLTGLTEFALRYLSLLWSVLAVALTIAIGRRLGGVRAGLLAGLFMAGSVFVIHWAQETRMYAQAATFAALGVWGYLSLPLSPAMQASAPPFPVNGERAYDPRFAKWTSVLHRGRQRSVSRSIFALVVGLMGAALTHYLGLFVIGIVNLHWLFTLRTRSQRENLRWVGLMVGVGAVLALWGLYAITRTRSGSAGGAFTPGFVFELSAALIAVGTSVDITRYTALTLVVVGVLGVGLALYTRTRPSNGLLVGLFALVPPLAIILLGALETRFYQPQPEERYFIVFAPVIYAGVGVALVTLLRRFRIVGALAIAGLIAVYGWAYLRDLDTRGYQDDYATLFRAVDALAEPDEPVLFVSDDRWPLVLYHLNRAEGWESDLRAVGFPSPLVYPDRTVPDDEMRRRIGDAERFWVVRIEQGIRDPDSWTTAWLDANFTPIYRQAIGYNGFTYYSADPDALRPQSDDVLWPPQDSARPGESVRVGAPGTVTWRYGDTVVRTDEADDWRVTSFEVHPAYPTGDYSVEVGGTRHPFRVTHANTPDASPTIRVEADFGKMTLLGYDLSDSTVRPGEAITFTLHWRVDEAMPTDYTVFAQLIGPFRETGPVWANADRYPALTPTSALWPGLTFTDAYTLTVPDDMPAGTHKLAFGLYQLDTGARLTTPDGLDAVTVGVGVE